MLAHARGVGVGLGYVGGGVGVGNVDVGVKSGVGVCVCVLGGRGYLVEHVAIGAESIHKTLHARRLTVQNVGPRGRLCEGLTVVACLYSSPNTPFSHYWSTQGMSGTECVHTRRYPTGEHTHRHEEPAFRGWLLVAAKQIDVSTWNTTICSPTVLMDRYGDSFWW